MLPNPLPTLESVAVNFTPVSSTLMDSQRALILKALQTAEWLVGGPNGAATRLGLKRTTLIAKMKKLGISRPAPRIEMNALAETRGRERWLAVGRLRGDDRTSRPNRGSCAQRGMERERAGTRSLVRAPSVVISTEDHRGPEKELILNFAHAPPAPEVPRRLNLQSNIVRFKRSPAAVPRGPPSFQSDGRHAVRISRRILSSSIGLEISGPGPTGSQLSSGTESKDVIFRGNEAACGWQTRRLGIQIRMVAGD